MGIQAHQGHGHLSLVLKKKSRYIIPGFKVGVWHLPSSREFTSRILPFGSPRFEHVLSIILERFPCHQYARGAQAQAQGANRHDVNGGGDAPVKRTENQNRTHHETKAIWAGAGGSTSGRWVPAPLPGSGSQYGAASRKGTPEDCRLRSTRHRDKLSTSLHQIAELRMCALSNRIREKANWREEVKYKVIVEKWRKEALGRGGEGDLEEPMRKLTTTMVKFCHLRTTTTRLHLDV